MDWSSESGGRTIQTAFADVGFQLLVMVLPLMGTGLSTSEPDAEAPTTVAEGVASSEVHELITVSLTGDGSLLRHDETVVLDAIVEELSSGSAEGVVLEVSPEAPYRELHAVLRAFETTGAVVWISESGGGDPHAP